MIITIQHLYSVPTWTSRQGYCAKGARLFFEKYGLSWQDFIKNGIEEQQLLATNNALAFHLVQHAKQLDVAQQQEQLINAVEELKNGQQ